MKIKLLCVGKTNFDFVNDGCKIYKSRLGHLVNFEMTIIPDIKNTKKMPVNEIKKKEGANILKTIKSGDFLCLLDEKGKHFTSEGFADFINKQTNMGTRQLVFCIGGAYGFSDEVYQRATLKLSLSKMTYSHQIVRVLFYEQLYRAYTIIKGIPYHNQ